MGVPKQKWTSEEETALKAGVAKYGPGKWSTILRDPEFVPVLHLRSNVDLKDKWRNMNFMGSGCGSRHRGRIGRLKTEPIRKPENLSTVSKEELDMESGISDPPTIIALPWQKGSSKMPIPRLDNLIVEAISNLKPPRDSSQAAISKYIEEKHSAPPNLEKLLRAELKALVDCGKLTKVNRQYKITPNSSDSGSNTNPSPSLPEAKNDYSLMADMKTFKILTKAEIDAELEKMKSMTPQEAAAVAVKAVAEAEAALSEAERAAREAEAAEADAELARVFAADAMKALKQTALCT